MSGKDLKEILYEQHITGRKLAGLLKMHERSVYGWFMQPVVKRSLLKRIATAANLDISLLVPTEQSFIIKEDQAPYGNPAIHHGERVKAIITEKDMSLNNFARRMQVTRQTLANWFKESEWKLGRLMEAAEHLGVPVTQLQGKAKAESFDKNVYKQLADVQKELQEIKALLAQKNPAN